MTTLDLAPVTVVTPWGEKLEPVRVVVTGEALTVTDREGRTITADAVRQVQRGRRTSTLDGELGQWSVREPCSCDGSKRRLNREWAGTPRVAS